MLIAAHANQAPKSRPDGTDKSYRMLCSYNDEAARIHSNSLYSAEFPA
jgi:hypothetical protein